MPSKVLLFDNVDLSGYVGTWQESANARINAVTVPRRHGALVSDAVVQDVRNIRITGTLVSLTASGLRTILDTLSELLSRQNKALQLWDDRYITAYKAQFVYSYVEGSALTAANYAIAFVCVNPFWISLTQNVILTTFNAMMTIDFTAKLYRQSFVLTNNGTFVAYPLYSLSCVGNTISKVIVQNLTLNRRFTYTGTIAAGTTLAVDVTNFTVTNNGASDLTNWTGDFIWLLAGANNIQVDFTFTGAPTNSNTLTASWYDRKY